ncbi:anthranilate synthase family protein [Streptomyces sp. NPDC050509]|uniref:anthranilate synthase family protein n=1 Tax=Streptomyces sp. NPDC050509 TaxID=3365620 RepID=UPI003788F606
MTAHEDGTGLLRRLTGPTPPASFALLHRPEADGGGRIDLLVGDVSEVAGTADLPLPPEGGRERHELLALLPFRQIGERGYEHYDDGEPLVVMAVTGQAVVPVDEVLAHLPDLPIEVRDSGFTTDDEEYADTVRQIIANEIGSGAGSNFVIKRAFTATIGNWSTRTALTLFGRLLRHTSGAYWTFLIRVDGRTFIGASPERHLTLDHGTAVMNPISGTYRYPPSGPSRDGVLDFLADRKEANELYMVVDEELKMMSRVCDGGAQVVGPRLREMAHLAHTEYFIEGRFDRDVREAIRETLFAPTVTGSPLESACRVIAKYETEGRGYYAGMVALLGRDPEGGRRLDSAILIRTADIDRAGHLRLGVGSTLVRDSDPRAEAAETRAKAAGLIAALHADPAEAAPVPVQPSVPGVPLLGALPEVAHALAARNMPLAPFWREPPDSRSRHLPHLAGRRALLIDAEDTFTAMGAALMRELGLEVTVRRFDEDYRLEGNDLVVVGPGPGDPRDTGDPKVTHLREVTARLIALGTPFLSVCLGHQALSGVLGLELVRKEVPNQGAQREIDLFGQREAVYFYNTFAAVSTRDSFPGPPARPAAVEVCRDPVNGEVHALRGQGFASVQFHPASVMTRDGSAVLDRLITDLFLTA